MKAAQRAYLVQGAVSFPSSPWASGWHYADSPFQGRGQVSSDNCWRKGPEGVREEMGCPPGCTKSDLQPTHFFSELPSSNTHTQPFPKDAASCPNTCEDLGQWGAGQTGPIQSPTTAISRSCLLL